MSKKEILETVVDPVIVIDAHEPDKLRYLMNLTGMDPFLNDPRIWGIVASDLICNIADVYAKHTNRNMRDVRDAIMRVLREENRLKDLDPERAAHDVTVLVTGKPRMN